MKGLVTTQSACRSLRYVARYSSTSQRNAAVKPHAAIHQPGCFNPVLEGSGAVLGLGSLIQPRSCQNRHSKLNLPAQTTHILLF